MSEGAHTVIGMSRPRPEQLPLWDVPDWLRMIGVFDLETTGNAPPAHAVIEIGWQDVALGQDGRWDLQGEGGSILVNPGRPIPPITMAIHHIRDEDVADARWWHDVARPVPVNIEFDGMRFDAAFRIDIMINGLLVVEVKSVERLGAVHAKQVLTYLRLTKQPVGLLINFGGETLKEGFRRLVNNYNPSASSAPLRE